MGGAVGWGVGGGGGGGGAEALTFKALQAPDILDVPEPLLLLGLVPRNFPPPCRGFEIPTTSELIHQGGYLGARFQAKPQNAEPTNPKKQNKTKQDSLFTTVEGFLVDL